MTLPRELHLQNDKIVQKPVEELRTLRQNEKNAAISLNQGTEKLDIVQPDKAELFISPKVIEEVLRFPSGVRPDSYTIKQKAS